MFFKPIIIITAAAALLFLLVIAMGCSHRSKFCHARFSLAQRAGWVTKKLARELKLNDQQKVKLDQIKNDIINKHNEMRAQKEDLVNVFIAEISKDTLKREILMGVLEKKHQDLEKMCGFAVDKLTEFHAMLTPEQRRKFTARITDFHNRMKE